MKKVIIDTNVLVSSIIKGRNPSKVIEFILENTEYIWVLTTDIRFEYEDVIVRRKFRLPIETIEKWMGIFSTCELIDDSNVIVHFPRDPKDEKFLKCAIASNADYLITGDKDFKDVEKIGNTIRISVSEFLRTVIEK